MSNIWCILSRRDKGAKATTSKHHNLLFLCLTHLYKGEHTKNSLWRGGRQLYIYMYMYMGERRRAASKLSMFIFPRVFIAQKNFAERERERELLCARALFSFPFSSPTTICASDLARRVISKKRFISRAYYFEIWSRFSNF